MSFILISIVAVAEYFEYDIIGNLKMQIQLSR